MRVRWIGTGLRGILRGRWFDRGGVDVRWGKWKGLWGNVGNACIYDGRGIDGDE